MANNCSGCHSNEGASVEVSASPQTFEPGDDVTFTVTVARSQGTAAVGGVFVGQPASGELRTIAGEGLTLVPGSGLTHSQPKPAVSGVVTFRFGWRAPAEPGGVTLAVAALAANGDGRSSGNVAGVARYLAAFGCTAELLYGDLDLDGHGTDLFETSIGCAGAPPPMGFSPLNDDCNDNDAAIHPLAVEKCNKKDDDCNGETDENAELLELWPDADGDGYYRDRTGTPLVGCVGTVGYAAEPGDCAPDDPNIHPGATEICNMLDDNCDGRIDERVRPQCGIGFCLRESYDCDPAHCTPGAPSPEKCNYLDDDCNDNVDDGETCAAGSACLAGRCIESEGVGAAGGGGAPPGGGGSGLGADSSGGVAGGDAGARGGSSSTAGAAAGGGTGVGGSSPGAASTEGTASGGARATPVKPSTNAPSGCSVGHGRASRRFGLVALLALMAVFGTLSAGRRRRR